MPKKLASGVVGQPQVQYPAYWPNGCPSLVNRYGTFTLIENPCADTVTPCEGTVGVCFQ
jgi:hypothetical protein